LAVALWASVSPEVDQPAGGNSQHPRSGCGPDEWRSGDILWLIDAVRRPPRGARPALKQLADNTLKGREIKVRGRGEGGKVEVKIPAGHVAGRRRAPDRQGRSS
jgi:hemolysin-activating ACP:hemolysin acyltransferase